MTAGEQKWDKKLNIRTGGRDASEEDAHHLPYEPTPYSVLERLAGTGWIAKDSLLIDYGCGKGRVPLFLSHRLGCRCIGIDFNASVLAEAERNLSTAAGTMRVSFLHESAERYAVPPDADRFYFFNPFSLPTLQSALSRIFDSLYDRPRRVRLIFYYPSDAYLGYLMNEDGLTLADSADCSDLFPGDGREKLLCFEAGG